MVACWEKPRQDKTKQDLLLHPDRGLRYYLKLHTEHDCVPFKTSGSWEGQGCYLETGLFSAPSYRMVSDHELIWWPLTASLLPIQDTYHRSRSSAYGASLLPIRCLIITHPLLQAARCIHKDLDWKYQVTSISPCWLLSHKHSKWQVSRLRCTEIKECPTLRLSLKSE